MFIIYDIIYVFAAIIYLPVMKFKGKYHPRFNERFGVISKQWKKKLRHEKNIWIHAVSVGEVLAISELIKKIKENHPDYQIVVTTVTITGQTLAENILKDVAVVNYSPLDFSWTVKKFINIIKPKLYISTETEIWPNLYSFLQKMKVPIMIINGRISDQSFKGYCTGKFLFKKILSQVDICCMQSQLDQQRIIHLGAKKK